MDGVEVFILGLGSGIEGDPGMPSCVWVRPTIPLILRCSAIPRSYCLRGAPSCVCIFWLALNATCLWLECPWLGMSDTSAPYSFLSEYLLSDPNSLWWYRPVMGLLVRCGLWPEGPFHEVEGVTRAGRVLPFPVPLRLIGWAPTLAATGFFVFLDLGLSRGSG